MAKKRLFSLFGKKKEEEETPASILLSELRTIEKRLSKTKVHESCINFIHALRRYYSKMLKERYSLSFEEINNEIRKSRAFSSKFKKALAEYNNKVSSLEFSSSQLTSTELTESINEFIRIINEMENERKEKQADEKSRKKQSKKKKRKFFWQKNRTKQGIEKMIINAYLLLDRSDLEEAAKAYERIKRDFSYLDEKEKESIKGDILELFIDIKKEMNKRKSKQ
jgi:hypothetical protein